MTLKEQKLLLKKRKQFIPESIKSIPDVLVPIFAAILQNQSRLIYDLVQKVQPLSENEYLKIVRMLLNFARLEDAQKICDLARQNGQAKSVNFFLEENKLRLLQEVQELGVGVFPIYVNFATRWDGPRLPQQGKVTQWFVGQCLAVDKSLLKLKIAQKNGKQVQVFFADVDKKLNPKVKAGDFIELHIGPRNKSYLLRDPLNLVPIEPELP